MANYIQKHSIGQVIDHKVLGKGTIVDIIGGVDETVTNKKIIHENNEAKLITESRVERQACYDIIQFDRDEKGQTRKFNDEILDDWLVK